MNLKVLAKMIDYFNNDVKRINHSLKVWTFASLIAEGEGINSTQQDIVHYVSILHDIGIKEAEKKHHSSSGIYQEIEGPAIARSILINLGIQEKIIERVCFIIGNHHTYKNINGLDFQILVEADFLVNIFEDNPPEASIKKMKKNYFKTETGKRLLEKMYSA
jgi:HD superfamily phosphodiesterase